MQHRETSINQIDSMHGLVSHITYIQPRGTLDILHMSFCVLGYVQGHVLTHSTFTSVTSLAEELANCHSHLASITHSERESAVEFAIYKSDSVTTIHTSC